MLNSTLFLKMKPYSNKKKIGRIIEIAVHLLFWAYIAYFFIQNSYLRPRASITKELLSVSLIASACYLNYFVIYPYFFKKRKIIYFLVSFLSVFIISQLEVYIVTPNIKNCFKTVPPQMLQGVIYGIKRSVFVRDLAFLSFFVILKLYTDARQAFLIEKEKALLEREKQQAEINLLKNQVAPHFLFNNLNKLHNDIEPLSKGISDKIVTLSQLLRHIINHSSQNFIPLSKEIEFIDNLILLENDHRYTNLDVKFSYMDIGANDIMVPPLLFESFVSNAFKYVKRQDGYIHINLEVVDSGKIKVLHFSCQNNIIENESASTSTKKGILNTQKGLDLIYRDTYELTAEKIDGNTFRVDLRLTNLSPKL